MNLGQSHRKSNNVILLKLCKRIHKSRRFTVFNLCNPIIFLRFIRVRKKNQQHTPRVAVCAYFALSTGSTPTVGSSNMSSSGFWSRAAPRETLRLWPPLQHQQKNMQQPKLKVAKVNLPRLWVSYLSLTLRRRDKPAWQTKRSIPNLQYCNTTISFILISENWLSESSN